MPRMTAGKRSELKSFWRAHLEGWRSSDLNQPEYCELHGLPLKRFGNWRAKFKHEDDVPRQKLLWRRGGVSICQSICLRKFPRPLLGAQWLNRLSLQESPASAPVSTAAA